VGQLIVTQGAADGPTTVAFAVVSLACSLLAAGTLIVNRVTRLFRPAFHDSLGQSRAGLDGIPAVAFVSKEFTARWASATLFRLASDGVIAVIDERKRVLESWDQAVEHISLEFIADPADVSMRAARGDVGCAVVCVLFGDPPRRGGRVEALRTVYAASGLAHVGEALVKRAGAQFGAVAPIAHGIARGAGLAGIAFGFVAAGLGSAASLIMGWLAILLGTAALIGSVLVRRSRMLNSDGIALRDGAERRRDILEDTTFDSVTVGERVLPWTVLFDLPSSTERLGEVSQRSGMSPHWYRSEAPFSAARFVSCVEAVQLRMMPGARFAVTDAGEFTALYAWQVGGGDGSGGFGGIFGDFGGGGGDGGGGFGGGGDGGGGGGGNS
jgi:hypothetical protein